RSRWPANWRNSCRTPGSRSHAPRARSRSGPAWWRTSSRTGTPTGSAGRPEQPVLGGPRGDPGATAGAEPGDDATDPVLDRVHAQMDPVGDLLVGVAVGDQGDDLQIVVQPHRAGGLHLQRPLHGLERLPGPVGITPRLPDQEIQAAVDVERGSLLLLEQLEAAGLSGQVLLEATQLGHVATDPLPADQLTVPVDVARVDLQLTDLPVRLQDPGLEVPARVSARQPQPEVLDRLGEGVGGDHLGEVLA